MTKLIRTEIVRKTWLVERTATITETIDNQEVVKWRVDVWDGDRHPFLTNQFNTLEAAGHFLRRLEENV